MVGEFGSLPPMLQWALTMLGGAGLGAFGWRLAVRGGRAEMEDSLEKKFATLEVLNRWGEKVTATQKVAETANDQAEAALSIAQRVEQRMDFLEKQIIPEMKEMNERLCELSVASATQTATLVTFMEEIRRQR